MKEYTVWRRKVVEHAQYIIVDADSAAGAIEAAKELNGWTTEDMLGGRNCNDTEWEYDVEGN